MCFPLQIITCSLRFSFYASVKFGHWMPKHFQLRQLRLKSVAVKYLDNPTTPVLRISINKINNYTHTFVKKGVMKTKKTSYTSRRLSRITQIYEILRRGEMTELIKLIKNIYFNTVRVRELHWLPIMINAPKSVLLMQRGEKLNIYILQEIQWLYKYILCLTKYKRKIKQR